MSYNLINMIDFSDVVIANGTAIVLLVMMLLNTKKPMKASLFDEKIFYLMVTATIFQCITETLSFYIDGRMVQGMREINYLLNSLLYVNCVLFAYEWTLYVDFKIFNDYDRLKRIYPYVAIPGILVAIGVIINFFYPVFFIIDASNTYIRTNLFILPYLITYGYLMYGVITTYRNKNKVNKYFFMPVSLFLVPVFIGSVIQYFCYGISLIWLGAAISLCTLHFSIQNEISYIDSLSGLYTRQYMNLYIKDQIKRIGYGYKLGGIMLDIDKFKVLNDKYGHLEGDNAISNVGKILLNSTSGMNALAFRYAGDEFIILMIVNNENEIVKAMKRIDDATEAFNDQNVKPYKLSFSMGFTVFKEDVDTFDDFLNRIDNEMYRNKRLN